MRKYNKRIFAVFYVYWCHRYARVKTTVLYINICCFIITVLSGIREWCRDWYHWIITPKTPIRRKYLRDLLYLQKTVPRKPPAVFKNKISSAQIELILTILFKIALPWQGRDRICLTSFNSPTPKIPDRRKNLGDISYTSRVIVDFVSNFVVMAKGVDRDGIFLTSFDSPTMKTSVSC